MKIKLTYDHYKSGGGFKEINRVLEVRKTEKGSDQFPRLTYIFKNGWALCVNLETNGMHQLCGKNHNTIAYPEFKILEEQ